MSSPNSQLEAKMSTPKNSKHCRCKQSKCLQLYCECFASGDYCNGCNCINCHNNTENEAARLQATQSILNRMIKSNRYSFRSGTASIPWKVLDNGVEAILWVEKHKACHCKKTGCVKKYCECFRAHMLCSEKCKCAGCKNIGACDRELTLPDIEHWNRETSINEDNIDSFAVFESSGYSLFSASRKRKALELYNSHEKDPLMQKLTREQQKANPLRDRLLSAFSVDIPDHIVSSAVSEFTCRSLVPDTLPNAMWKFCLDLVAVSEVTKVHADYSGFIYADAGEGRLLYSGSDSSLPEEKYIQFAGAKGPNWNLMHGNTPDLYEEQERLVLTHARDFFMELITSVHSKARSSMAGQPEDVGSGV